MPICGNMADTTALSILTPLPQFVSPTLRRVTCRSGSLATSGGQSQRSFTASDSSQAPGDIPPETCPRLHPKLDKPRRCGNRPDGGRRHNPAGRGGFRAAGNQDRNQPGVPRFNPAAAGAIRTAAGWLGNPANATEPDQPKGAHINAPPMHPSPPLPAVSRSGRSSAATCPAGPRCIRFPGKSPPRSPECTGSR